MDTVKVQQVIICTMNRRGEGTKDDPIRVLTEVYSLAGEKIAENDPGLERAMITQGGEMSNQKYIIKKMLAALKAVGTAGVDYEKLCDEAIKEAEGLGI